MLGQSGLSLPPPLGVQRDAFIIQPRSLSLSSSCSFTTPTQQWPWLQGSECSRRRRVRPRGELQSSLVILREHTLRRLLPSQFTGDQWKYYWGITETDKFGRLYEAMSMTFFGLWTSWFLTFMIGIPLATGLGTIFLFYWILAPGLAAYRRNVSFRGMKFARHWDDEGIFGALFSGRIVRVGRITQNREYNRPEAFVMSVEDEQGRKLRVYAPVIPSYKGVRVGMRCVGIVLSNSPDFNDLEGVSDLFVPACGAWVGDYPYLDKIRFKAFLGERLRRGRARWRRQLPTATRRRRDRGDENDDDGDEEGEPLQLFIPEDKGRQELLEVRRGTGAPTRRQINDES